VTIMHKLATAFGRFFFACALGIPAAHAADIAIGRSIRPHNIDIAARFGYAEIEFIDEGEQPNGIPNRNRVVNLDAVLPLHAGRWTLYAKAGLSSSRFSYNGSGNGYHNRTGFTGQNAGIGVEYALTPQWAVRVQTVWMRYQQSDIPAYECFTYTSAMLVFNF